MRVVAGRWAGRQLVSPAGRVRPTSEALRDAWMTMLGAAVDDARVLDLFAGSGALGIEALSRGARSCDFVENGPSALHALKANIAALRLQRRVRLFKRDAIQFTQRIHGVAYDIALADPPYGSRKLDRVVGDWLARPFSALLAVEHGPDWTPPMRGKSKRVGDSVVTLFRAPRTPRGAPPTEPIG